MIAVTSTILMSCDDRHDCHCVVPLHSTPCGTVPPHNGLVALRRVNAASYGLQGNVSKPDECCGLLTGWDRIHFHPAERGLTQGVAAKQRLEKL